MGIFDLLSCVHNACTNEFYTRERAEKDLEQVTCCVVDPDDRGDDARCCSLVRSSNSKMDLGFGHEGERSSRGSDGYDNMMVIRKANMFLSLQAIAFLLVGCSLLLFPHETSTKFLLSEEYLEMNNLGGLSTEEQAILDQLDRDSDLADRRIGMAEQHRNTAYEMMKSALSKVFTLDSQSNNGQYQTDEERNLYEAERERLKLEAMKQLEIANKLEQRKLAKQSPVHVTVTSFCRFFGAACVSFAAFSYMVTLETRHVPLDRLIAAEIFLRVSIIWYALGIVSMVLSSVDKTGGSESTSYMTIAILVYMICLFVSNHCRSALYELFRRCHVKQTTIERSKRFGQSALGEDSDSSSDSIF